MGSPITWQNVNSSESRLVGQLMEGAQRGITGGFDKLGDVITNRENVNQGVADRARGAAEQDFMNQLYGYKNPAELQAARESGALAQQLAALDPRNQAAARTAMDARTGTLQGQTTANDVFAVNQMKQPMVLANTAADVENAPITRELARNSLLSRQAVEPITQATALTTATNAQGAAKLTERLRPLTDANAVTEATIRGTQLVVDGTTAVQQRQDQVIATEVARTAQAYQESQTTGRTKLGALAKTLGLPIDSAGAPDIVNMTKEQRLRLDTAAVQAGHTQTSSDLFGGNTKAAESALAALRKNPNITPEAIARNQAKITGAFDTTRTGLPVGNDALTLATNRAQADVVQKEKDARNRFAPNSPDALNTYEQLATELSGMVPADAQEDVPELQKMLGKFATTGIKLKDGRYITPSVQDIKSAVRGYTPGWKGNWFNNTQAQDIEKQLAKDLEGSNVTQMLADAEESRRANRARDVRNILNPLAPAMQPLNPMQLPPPDPKKR
jgi:hypothetical protein